MSRSIVGRDAELAALHDFVDSLSAGTAVLVLQGEAGMGKSTLWSAGIAAADRSGLRALEARPAEAEAAHSFSGIGDLLDPVLDEALAPLPAPQRRALSRALLLEEASDPIPDPHAVGVALLNALRALAEERTLVLAIDDVQWLDIASAGTLAYAARRLRNERIGILLARRARLDSPLVSEVRKSLSADRFREVEVGPLDREALHHVVHDHLGIALPRPLLAEVHHTSGGNPFYALEVVRTLQRTAAVVGAGGQLPVPESLRELVHGRLLALAPECRDCLVVASALSNPTVGLVEAASGVSRDVGLAPALESGIVELEGDRIRFTHPLLAAGAYEIADPFRRAAVHARLAELVDDPEARARHSAASITDPDESVAAALEEAADRARARGAPRAAAVLLERARELTPADLSDEVLRRAADAAYLHFESGDGRRAEAQLGELIEPLASGRQRAKVLSVLARVRTYEAPDEAAQLFLQVVEEAEGDRELLADAHEGVASCLFYVFGQLGESVRHADKALGLARELGDKALEGDVLVSKVGAETLLGRSEARASADEARALQDAATDRRLLDQPLVAVAEYWLWTDFPSRAQAMLVEMLRQAEEMGDESSRPYLLFLLGEAECVLGEFGEALDHARDGRDAAERSGQPLFAACNLALESMAQAHLGDPDETRAAAERAYAVMTSTSGHVRLVVASGIGHLELAREAPDRVVASLHPMLEFVRREGIVEPTAIRFVVDYVESLIQLGRHDEALAVLEPYESHSRRPERASALANCMRCRGLLAAQAGRLAEALAAYERALDFHERVDLPLDRGRTLLALGASLRRAKRRRDARHTLEESLRLFERIGAGLWAARARAELSRISGRAPAVGTLTPAEERVAALVAEGKTNREVAAALFLSERTVEGHLSHVFGKLGVRSRTELTRALSTRPTQGVAGPNRGDSPVSSTSSAP